MLRAQFSRRQRIRYQQALDSAVDRFLPDAALFVEGEAKIRTPVDTGTLRNSITHDVRDNVAIVGTNTKYAPHVEYGTRHMRAQPYLRPALDENRKRLRRMFAQIFREVFKRGR